jgi:glycerol-3-phosphate acyltransferase PlsX
MTRIYKKYDYNEYGGALLLGINGTAMICHGSSQARTVKNAIIASKKFHTEKINDKIMQYLSGSPFAEKPQDDKPRILQLRTADGRTD